MTQSTELNKEITQLRAELNTLHEQRQEFYKKKDDISTKIKQRLQELRTLKEDRDKKTSSIKILKEERKVAQQAFFEKVGVAKELHEQKGQKRLPFGKEHPSQLKKELERLNTTIETEAIPFSQEQKLMKRIKELQKKLEEQQALFEATKQARKESVEASTLKKTADTIHEQVQETARSAQEKHEALMSIRNTLDTLRKEEQDIKTIIAPLSERIHSINEKLGENLAEFSVHKQQERNNKRHQQQNKHEQAEKRKQATLAEKQKEVSARMKKGGKLTTEDLLVLQSMDDGSVIF